MFDNRTKKLTNNNKFNNKRVIKGWVEKLSNQPGIPSQSYNSGKVTTLKVDYHAAQDATRDKSWRP